ncbi:TPA: hypothetical protein ACH3X3_013150 [Trebouxia sp. C0006]
MEEPYDYELQGEQRSFLLPAGNSESTQLKYAEQKEAKAQAAWTSATSQGIHHSDSHAIAAALHIPAQAQGGQYALSELDQFDRMINWMLVTYLGCLGLGWGLLLFDWVWNKSHKLHSQEPWVNDAVVIGGASAVLSPIIQWGHTILQSKPQASEVAKKRYYFFCVMWSVYVSIVTISISVACIRFVLGESGSLHSFITTTSNHLVVARISASLISWTSGKLFIKWYRDKLSAGPMF